jgi:hypothetical protein
MLSNTLKEQVIKYVLERRCKEQGGFCFYRLEEPSGADTYYSLWILDALIEPFADERTVSYLEKLQSPDGSYESIFSAFYSIKGLQLLKRKPLYDPSKYISANMADYHIHAEDIPAEITSIFKRLLFLIEICGSAGLVRSEAIKKIQRLVLPFQNSDGGFGFNNSSLGETAMAVQILQALDCGVDNSRVRDFIRQCERPDYGFTGVPGTSLSYIEHIQAGLKLSYAISYKPKYLDACEVFVSGCRRRNGGFSRAISDGIATIENTFFAVYSLLLILKLNQTN